ncbi:Glycosyltransferase involved in cell wall bisynthesis [Porphyromonadaceae bacterium KH3CP3RA]|nr:Glycosyltransferase involved in cell wall bisynthesis [Porphyromonadaceae bacterium KH3CP3RA]
MIVPKEKDHTPFVQIRMKKQPFVSIICVTYNAASCISGCIDSIIEQRCADDVELIIIDGNSTDGTQEILKRYGDRIAFWKSEPDEGIYDAMNKALEYIHGQWVYFIGADDRLLSDFSTFVENELKDQHKVYYANVLWEGIKSRGFVSDYEQAKGGIFHQAIIYPASVFKKYRYNTKYKVSADYALNMQLHRDKSYEFEYREYIIAYFNNTGVSSYGEDEVFLRDKRKLIMENFGIVVRFRYNFRIIKHKLRKKRIRPNNN